jgi:glycosyltransferase involved in cell wall biosynthesis
MVFWLQKPMQVYTPVFRELAAQPGVDLRVLFAASSERDLLPPDKEIGPQAQWSRSLLDGYEHRCIGSGFADGYRSAVAESRDGACRLAVLQGTNHPAFRGVLAGGLMRKLPLLVRYDATLKYGTESLVKGLAKAALLPPVLKRLPYVAYTGKWAREYLRHYGAAPRSLVWFPYVIDNDLVFLSVAKFAEREVPLDALRAFAAAAIPGAHLVLVGDGPLRCAIESFRDSHKLANVHLCGYVPYDTLPRYYAISDVFVHAARDEVWGVSVNEAMVCGMPVMAADTVGAAADLVIDGISGYIYPSGDFEALAGLLTRVAGGRQATERMGRQALGIIAKLHPATVAERLAALLPGPGDGAGKQETRIQETSARA